MRTNIVRKYLICGGLTLVLALCLSGCFAEKAKEEARPEGNAPAAVQKKMAAPVEVSYQAERGARAAVPFPVIIEIRLLSDTGDLELVIEGGDGVSLEGGSLVILYPPQKAGAVIRRELGVTADYEGTNYLRLVLKGEFDGRTMRYPKALPLYVGDSTDAPAVYKSTNPLIREDEGPGLILMPAQEPGR